MFKFGFSKDDQEDDNNTTQETTPANDWLEAKEISIDLHLAITEFLNNTEDPINLIEINDNIKIECVSDKLIAKIIEHSKKNSDILQKVEANNSDLITAIYEGGLKIWQCTYDLLDYLSTEEIDYEGKKVLDLGCGAGILGIFAFLQGARVCFQDYNREVIEFITIPNLILNENEESNRNQCQFYAGDWQSFVDLIENEYENENNKFDFIFTSETIYNCDNYTKLIHLFKKLLKKSGILYLAAKTCYFGVGGGTREFEDRIQVDNCFTIKSIWKTTQGVQREILKLTYNK